MASDFKHSVISIAHAINDYSQTVADARSVNTGRTYRNAMKSFLAILRDNGVDADTVSVSSLSEDAVVWMTSGLKTYSPSTERLYLTALTGFYEYLAAERLMDVNLQRIRMLIRKRGRRPGQRLPQFPKDAIDKVLVYAQDMIKIDLSDDAEKLRLLRDRAFLLTLADTGLRVHEACNLRRGDLDWNEGHALITGKGNQQAIVRFSRRSQQAIKAYLNARSVLDGGTGKSLTALPLFARHDRGAGKKITPITTATGRNIVNERVIEALGSEAEGRITPHSFRHYFVSRVLMVSGNLKLAQELARHRNIAVTQRYAHLSDNELDSGYWEVFEEK
jgi:integrase/recombinase XerC